MEFIIDTAGEVRVRAGSLDVQELRGLLRKPGRRAVSLAGCNSTVTFDRRMRGSPDFQLL